MAIARVNSAAIGSASSGNLVTPTFAATTGNLIVAFIRDTTGGSGVSTLTDTAGNTYTLAVKNETHDPYLYCYYAKNITGNASNALHAVSVGAAFVHGYLVAVQYSGCDTTAPLDVHVANPAAAATDCLSAAFTTTAANEVVVMAISQNNFATYSAGTGYTLINGTLDIGGGNGGGVEELITSSVLTSSTAHITSTANNQYTTLLVSFKDASQPSTFAPLTSPAAHGSSQAVLLAARPHRL